MKSFFRAAFLRACVCLALSAPAHATESTAAIEYYDAGLDHYFITASQDEIVALNSGRFFGWFPTGLSFAVLAPDSAAAGSTPVCRFYGNPAAGLDSHFYSADPAECQQVLVKYPGIWLLESWNVFRAYMPDAVTDTCPTGTKPIYRLWNQRPDVNHRYTDRSDVALAMEGAGYIPEGYGAGPLPVAFCEPTTNMAALSCSVGTTNATPPVGSNITLTAACSGNPTQYTWVGCTSSTNTCTTTSAALGGKAYVVTASNAVAASPPAVVSVVWQPAQTPGSVICSLATSNAAPFVNTNVTLTASCIGNPTSFSWVGCTSSTNSCATTSASVGARSYSVTASNSANTSAPIGISINWQATAPPPPGISCVLDTSNIVPPVGSSITLTATCSGNPTSYAWAGCTSTGNTCAATSATAGIRSYAVTASNGANTSAPATIDVNWQPVTPPPAGMPTSADYLPKAQDPRANMGFGTSAGYSAMKRMANGHMIVFGMSHTPNENNAVTTYNPVANTWTVRIPNTVAPWPQGSVSGRTFLGNRDNQVNLMIRPLNQYWVMEGERGQTMDGNYRGVVDTVSWQWKYIDDTYVFPPSGDNPFKVWDGVGEWIDTLNVGVIYGSVRYAPSDTLQVFIPTGASPAFRRSAWANQWGAESFPGAQLLRYISQSNWIRGNKIHIYGGAIQDRNTSAITDNATIYELDVTAVPGGGQPVMRPVSTNTLPAAQQVKGDAILGDLWPSKDMAVITDGRKMNVYDYASGTWVYVPINNPPGDIGNSPNSEGSGAQGRWAPEINQFIVLGQNGATFGVRLNFDGPPPPANPSISGFAATPSSIVAGASAVLNATVSNATSLQLDGVPVTLPVTVTPAATHTYTLTAIGALGTTPTTATTTVTVSAPPPPPPPPPNPGSLTVTATAVSYAGVGIALGMGKQLDFARVGNRWYKMAGDHGPTGSPLDVSIPPLQEQGGRQEILSFNGSANDWHEDTPYYLPASYGVQGGNPDDSAFVVTVGNEIWVANSETNHYTNPQPPAAAQQFELRNQIGAYTPPTAQWPLGHWRAVAPVPSILHGDRAWRGFYDSLRNRIVIPVTWGGSLVWCLIDATTGADLTQYANGVPYVWGDHTFSVAGVAPDFTNRQFYMYDVYTSELWRADMDTLALTKVADLPEPAGSTQSAIKMTWHPDLRAVVLAASKIEIYEVDSGKISTLARPDGFVNGAGNYVGTSTIFFDPDTHDVISIGTMDWDTGINPGKYWRLRIQ